MDERPWWHPSRDDEWDEPLPTVVILEPDYGAELPLTSEEGMLGWQQTCSPRNSWTSWQEAFESGFHFDTGWRSRQLRDKWATQASELEAQSVRNRADALSWLCISGRSTTTNKSQHAPSRRIWRASGRAGIRPPGSRPSLRLPADGCARRRSSN